MTQAKILLKVRSPLILPSEAIRSFGNRRWLPPVRPLLMRPGIGFLGKGNVTAGSALYTTPGSGNFIVPEYEFLTITLAASGGGGGEGGFAVGINFFNGNPGADATDCTISSLFLVAGGGKGGTGGKGNGNNGVTGADGTASGGDLNTTGGGAAGGSGGSHAGNGGDGRPGGKGGLCQKTYTAGQIAIGTSLAWLLGAPGAGGNGGSSAQDGSAGSPGYVGFNWA